MPCSEERQQLRGEGREARSDVRTLVTYEAYCACGWSVVRSKESDADAAADKHDALCARTQP